jgi:hypothetical protein
MTQKYLDSLTYQIIGSAIEVHKEIGPGLLESVYEKCLKHLLEENCLLPIHEAQLLTYLKLMEKPKGLLLNFNCVNLFKEGQKTLVTDRYAKLPKG